MSHLMDHKGWFFAISILLIIPGLISLLMFGLKLGIDFSGGTIIEYKLARVISIDDFRQEIRSQGIEVLTLRLRD